MKLTFWGTCGSLPAPIEAELIRQKLFRALKMARGRDMPSDADILRFIDEELPLSIQGTYGGNTSCVELTIDTDTVHLLDAGSGLREYSEHYMKSGQANKPREFHIFMTHLHWDHIQGFPFFAPAYIPGNKVVFHGCHDSVEQAIREQMNAPCFPVPFDVMKAEISFVTHEVTKRFKIGPLQVDTIRQNHPGESYGYRFTHHDKVAVYSTDSEHKEDAYKEDYRFIDFFRDADLVIFDAQYTLHDATFNKVDWGHSSNIMGVELASRARAKHLVLFHHDPSNTDEELDEYLVSTRTYSDIYYSETDPNRKKPQYPEKISLAFDGLKIVL